MRILSIGNFVTGWDGSICDEEHIAKALEEFGHTVYKIQREDHSTLPVFDFVEKPIDFVLISQYDQYPIDWIPRLKEQYSCPVIFAAFDYQEWEQEWCEKLIEGADLYLSKRIADSKYPNWQYWSQDFSPKFLDKYEQTTNKDIDILFTGSYLPWATERNETIQAVSEWASKNEYSFVIHSVNQWPQGNEGPIMDEGLPELYARAKVVLSIDHTLEAGYWSDRNAQVMACGGFVLFRYVPLSETVFRNHIAYFYDIEDCLEKLGNLLEPFIAPIREEYARDGYEYAQKNLMVKNRVMDLLTIVESIL